MVLKAASPLEGRISECFLLRLLVAVAAKTAEGATTLCVRVNPIGS